MGPGRTGLWLKLKSDYIPGLGDTVDLLMFGGSYTRSSHDRKGGCVWEEEKKKDACVLACLEI